MLNEYTVEKLKPYPMVVLTVVARPHVYAIRDDHLNSLTDRTNTLHGQVFEDFQLQLGFLRKLLIFSF